MAISTDLIPDIEQSLSVLRQRHLGATADVLKYAPRRLRVEPRDAGMERAEADYWRKRAFKAETRLRALETRVQGLAAHTR